MAKYSVGDIVMAKGNSLLKGDFVVGIIIDMRYFNSDSPSYLIEWSDGDRDAYTEESVDRYKTILDAYKKDKVQCLKRISTSAV